MRTNQVVVLNWSDGSTNKFLSEDIEMEDFILWKQSKYPDISYSVQVIPKDQYELQFN
jgi:hypothetical protein